MARSPLEVHFFWDKSHQPELDWEKWLATVKLAIMVKENIQVDKLLQPRPENEELDYPTEPHYKPALPGETTAERRQREQRNVKRRTDWQNTCKEIEDKGPQVDNTPWDEADNKTKSHIYLLLGAQATNIFHQRFPRTDIQKCTTDALVEQLREAFIQTRNETFDRFQFFRCRLKEGESLEVFHSRIKKHASVCNWEHLEESPVKSIFIQGMNNQQIQMDLLSEERTPSEALQYALARERGQESQQKVINTNTNRRLPTLRQQISPGPPECMPRKERSMAEYAKRSAVSQNSANQKCPHDHNTICNNDDNKITPANKITPVINNKTETTNWLRGRHHRE